MKAVWSDFISNFMYAVKVYTCMCINMHCSNFRNILSDISMEKMMYKVWLHKTLHNRVRRDFVHHKYLRDVDVDMIALRFQNLLKRT